MKDNAAKKELIELDQFILSHYPKLARMMEDLAYGRSMKGYIRKWRSSNYTTSFAGYKFLRLIINWMKSR